MQYFSQMVGIPVIDAADETIGRVNDLGIATGEVFPRITSLAFKGPGAEPFMISWRKYVDSFDEEAVHLKCPASDIRFSYLQPEEVLVARDLLNKQIVDTRGLKVVRVNDLKLSQAGSHQLRLLGAEVGARGILRSLSPILERAVCAVGHAIGKEIPEKIIAWSYMDLLDKKLQDVQLSVSHKTLENMHPADIADIIEKLDPRLRSQVFAQLDLARAADAMAELDEDQAAEIVHEMDAGEASRVLSEMSPDDAAELLSELDYEKAETLLRLMGVKEEQAIRQLLGYKDDTAGRIMTSEFLALSPKKTVADAIAAVKDAEQEAREMTNYLYLVDEDKTLKGVLSLRSLLVHDDGEELSSIMERELISCNPDTDQEEVAETISKYNLLALPVVQENGQMLGIVTVDDALDVLEEEHEEDLQLAGAHTTGDKDTSGAPSELPWLLSNQLWLIFWAVGALLMGILLVPLKLPPAALLAAVALPVALLMSDAMVSYVTNFYIEYDFDDENKPHNGVFVARGLLASFFAMLILVLVVLGLSGLIEGMGLLQTQLPFLVSGFVSAAISALVAYATAPLYLHLLYVHDQAGKDTSRLTMRIVAYLVVLAVFLLLSALFVHVPLVLLV